MGSPGARSVGRTLAVVASVVVLLLAARADAVPFAGERFAPIVDMSGEAALDLRSVTVTPGEDGAATFGLTFSGPFSSPFDGYRVSVSVGDPTAKRTRWTLAVVGGQVVGIVETGDGTQWTQVATATATLDPAAGTGSIDAEPGTPPAGSALWVDAELPTPLGSIRAASTYFSYDVLAAPQADPSVAGSVWAAVRDPEGTLTGAAVRIPGAAPTASIVNRALVLSSADAPPSLVLGQPVAAAADTVRFLDATGVAPGDGGYLLVDRVSGEVRFFTVDNGVATEVVGAADRLVPADAAASGAPGTRTVSFDLAAVERELGLPDDPSDVALAVDRTLTLTDGSAAVATGAAATAASLEAVGTTPAAPVGDDVVEPVSASSSNDGVPVALLLGLAAAALVIGGVVLGVVLARRRRARHDSLVAEGWFDRDLAAGPVRPPGSAAEARSMPEFAAAAVARPEPPLPPDAPAESVVPQSDVPEPVASDASDASESTEPVLDLDAPNDTAIVAQPPSDDAARTTQDRALEELEAQFADLFERVDRLGPARERS